MTIAVFVLWLRTNWQGLAAGLVLGVAVMGLSCNREAPVVATASASTALSGGATAHSGATIELPARPGRPASPCPPNKICPECPECPAVKIVYDCGASVSGAAASGVSASASVGGSKGLALSVWAGGGILTDFQAVTGGYGEVRGDLGDWSVPLRVESGLKGTLGLSYRFFGP